MAAVFFAAECGVQRVHSFEPVEPIYRLLKANTRAYPACRTETCAIGRRSGEAEITYYPRADAMSGLHADPERDTRLVDRVMQNRGVRQPMRRDQLAGRYEAETLSCRVRALSDVIAESGESSIDLLKIDVERGELDVLEGISFDDWPKVRQVVAEVHDEPGRVDRIEGLLGEHGFTTTWDQASSMRGTGVEVVYARRPES